MNLLRLIKKKPIPMYELPDYRYELGFKREDKYVTNAFTVIFGFRTLDGFYAFLYDNTTKKYSKFIATGGNSGNRTFATVVSIKELREFLHGYGVPRDMVNKLIPKK